ncbi:hypothetical protein HOLleu_31220 [Holothuria leucospilota]|uniref:Uncharacterized protein n=1 Tax=Holothuria leucospilota TaxID=206669 RepID=A0A9Q0YQ48_HOLLE|nr:hypothetical protein HOLleu_31220 [Holothuria leucospilota]
MQGTCSLLSRLEITSRISLVITDTARKAADGSFKPSVWFNFSLWCFLSTSPSMIRAMLYLRIGINSDRMYYCFYFTFHLYMYVYIYNANSHLKGKLLYLLVHRAKKR